MDEDYKTVFFHLRNILNKYHDNKIRYLMIRNFLKGIEIGMFNNKFDFSKMIAILKINSRFKNFFSSFTTNYSNDHLKIFDEEYIIEKDIQNQFNSFIRPDDSINMNSTCYTENENDSKIENVLDKTAKCNKTKNRSKYKKNQYEKKIDFKQNSSEMKFESCTDINKNEINYDIINFKTNFNEISKLDLDTNVEDELNNISSFHYKQISEKLVTETSIENIDKNGFDDSQENFLKQSLKLEKKIKEKRNSLNNEINKNKNQDKFNETIVKNSKSFFSTKNLVSILNESILIKNNKELINNSELDQTSKMNLIENVIDLNIYKSDDTNKEEIKQNLLNLKEENSELGKLNEILEREINLLKSLILINNLNSTNNGERDNDQRQYYNKNYFIEMCNDNNLQELVQDDGLFKKHKTLHTLMIKIKNIREQLDLFRKEFEEDRNRFLELMHDIHFRVIDYFQKEIKTRKIMEEKVSNIKKLI